MQLEFAKMHGAGNDFVVLLGVPPNKARRDRLVPRLCDRHTGIGADGVLWLARGTANDAFAFHWYGFNSDGSSITTCINGFRCAVLRATELGWGDDELSFRAGPNHLTASVSQTGITLTTPLPHVGLPVALPAGSPGQIGYPVDTGDPHLVVEVTHELLASMAPDEFRQYAKRLRWWREVFPAGANVHFVSRGEPMWTIRSFERGVEDETLACGSGCLASLCAIGSQADEREVRVLTQSGEVLTFTRGADTWLVSGPARTVFVGAIDTTVWLF